MLKLFTKVTAVTLGLSAPLCLHGLKCRAFHAPANNPLLTSHAFPAFDRIQPFHFASALAVKFDVVKTRVRELKETHAAAEGKHTVKFEDIAVWYSSSSEARAWTVCHVGIGGDDAGSTGVPFP